MFKVIKKCKKKQYFYLFAKTKLLCSFQINKQLSINNLSTNHKYILIFNKIKYIYFCLKKNIKFKKYKKIKRNYLNIVKKNNLKLCL